MKYTNPIVKGFYPDPSVCEVNSKYYMVCSSFQYFPGVPLFESDDLVNWKQIGHVLTRKTQVMLEKINSSGGVFAPTIRYNDGRFYMVTTNDTTHQNFYVYTDDIYGEWSDPIYIDQGGIDPSLLFENGKTYFISTCDGGIMQCEIDIESGRKLTESKYIWHGSGGRYIESPHMYKIGGKYLLMAAEGGTEYGHMVTCAMADDPWGKFESCPFNPVLTNRNKAPYIIQGIGHGDLAQDKNGNWFILTLGFRQIGIWTPFHHLGREVFLTPIEFDENGWIKAGKDGTTGFEYEIDGDFVQESKTSYTFENTDWNIDWCFMRHPTEENYKLDDNKAVLKGTEITLNEVDSPTFIGIRQHDFNMMLTVDVKMLDGGTDAVGGVTVYMSETAHYDIVLKKTENGYTCALILNVGNIHHVQNEITVDTNAVTLKIQADSMCYNFMCVVNGKEKYLGNAMSKYLSSEVAEGFTGVVNGLFAVNGTAEFTGFEMKYSDR